jgi:hypothetical protein
VCNDQSAFGGGDFDPNNPFTPDIKVYNQNERLIRNNLGKPTSSGGFQPEGPAVDVGFVRGFSGGRLFATDSNQATHAHNGPNNSSRIVTVNPTNGTVTPFITGLPTVTIRRSSWPSRAAGSTGRKGQRRTAESLAWTTAAARTSKISRVRTLC